MHRYSNALVVLAGLVGALAIVETGVRLLLESDARSYGTLFGVPLPPLKLVAADGSTETPRDTPFRDVVVDGRRITVGDMTGYYRYDELLGYTQLENARSANGWWQTNSIGAQASKPTTPRSTIGVQRLVLLGDSFARSSGLPAQDSWVSYVETANPSVEIVNLAVDGYGMAQANLRYESLKDAIEHRGVLMMFVPEADLWRDVNTIRDAGGGDWNMPIVLPRYVLEQGRLRLVRSPYADPADVYRENRDGLDPALQEHLRRFDRFYFRLFYGTPPILGRLATYKTIVAAWGQLDRNRRHREQRRSDSEAMQVSRAIFLALQEQLQRNSRDFHLLVLPTPRQLGQMRDDSKHVREWEQVVAATCAGLASCADLGPDLVAVPADQIDLAYDGNHYGVSANRAIASAVTKVLARRARLPPLPF
jgi:hypothetical protein